MIGVLGFRIRVLGHRVGLKVVPPPAWANQPGCVLQKGDMHSKSILSILISVSSPCYRVAGACGLHGGGQVVAYCQVLFIHGNMKRKVGRPRHTWGKCVCADLRCLVKMRGVGRLHIRLRVLGGKGCGIVHTLGKADG